MLGIENKGILNGGKPIEGKPIQLIRVEGVKEGDKLVDKLVVNPEALEILEKLDGNVAVCCVVGPYRSGKSFILNLLLNRSDGFVLGDSVQSCTRGIWMWNKPIVFENKKGSSSLILLDTEGLGSFDRDPVVDSKIFVASLLLASLFVYNTKHVIDRDAIVKLGLMADLGKFIDNSTPKSEHSSADVKNDENDLTNLPNFVWVVRDFNLKNPFDTSNDYMNEALKLETSKNKNAHDANLIRESITKSFRTFDCHLIPEPIDAGLGGKSRADTLQHLEKEKLEDLNESFRSAIRKLCQHIIENIQPKSLFKTHLAARAYTNYILGVVQQLNSKERVSLVTSMTVSIKYASKKSLDKAIKKYKTGMADVKLPMAWDLLNDHHKYIFASCMDNLQWNLNGENESTKPYLEEFAQQISQQEWFEIREKNRKAMKKDLCMRLNNLWDMKIARFFEKSAQEVTSSGGGGGEFENAFRLMRSEYFEEGHRKYGECAEVSEFYNDWYKAKDVERFIKNFAQLSDQARERLKAEQRENEERAERIRIEQRHEETERHQKAAIEAIQGSLTKIQQRNAELVKQMKEDAKRHADHIDKLTQNLRDNVGFHMGFHAGFNPGGIFQPTTPARIESVPLRIGIGYNPGEFFMSTAPARIDPTAPARIDPTAPARIDPTVPARIGLGYNP